MKKQPVNFIDSIWNAFSSSSNPAIKGAVAIYETNQLLKEMDEVIQKPSNDFWKFYHETQLREKLGLPPV